MRSTEASGVEAGGFGDRRSAAPDKPRAAPATPSPVALAIVATALIAATLFIGVDALRTFNDLAHRDSIATRLASAKTMLARQAITLPIDATDLEIGADAALSGLLQRGLAAYGLALLTAGAGLVRRKRMAPTAEPAALDDQLASIHAQFRDLARRYHEEKLRAEAANRSKTTFLAHLSHDIRTPLNHIIGFAELMRHETYGPLGDERYAGYVDTIRSSGERLLSFFSTILDLAELEGGRRVLETDRIEIDDLLASASRRFAGQAQHARVALVAGAPCRSVLLGDRFSLERVLGNLLDNAIRFTPAGGKVTLAAHVASDGVVLEVTDTGIGMGPDRLATLSQPFAFGDAALTSDRQGAGLGLAIARSIVELSGGHLAIDSRPGLGTTVAVSLPLPAAELPMSAAA